MVALFSGLSIVCRRSMAYGRGLWAQAIEYGFYINGVHVIKRGIDNFVLEEWNCGFLRNINIFRNL